MSKHNYQNYSKRYNNQKPQVEKPAVEETAEEIVEQVEDTAEEQIEETVEGVEEVEEVSLEDAVETVIGIVSDCKKLNVRKLPSPDADKVTVVEEGTPLMLDLDNSTGNYYKVYTESGVEGYCLKEYVAVR